MTRRVKKMEEERNRTIRVITYSRVSTQGQTSTEVQQKVLEDAEKELAQLQNAIGKDTERIIIDQVMEKRTAADKEGIFDPISYMQLRPKFYELYLKAQKNEFDELWVWSWSRFSRSDFQPILLKMFLAQRVTVKVLSGSNDALGSKIEGIMNTRFIEDLRETAKREHNHRIAKGLSVNRPPYGYQFNAKHKLIPDKNAPLIQKIFMLRASGVAMKDICERVFLYKWNLKTRRYSKISPAHSVISYILKNPVYSGKVIYNKEIHDGLHKPLISEELYGVVNNGKNKES